jgi:hypothetical protein
MWVRFVAGAYVLPAGPAAAGSTACSWTNTASPPPSKSLFDSGCLPLCMRLRNIWRSAEGPAGASP